MTLERDTVIKFEEVEKRIRSLNKKISVHNKEINDLKSDMFTLNDNNLNLIKNTETFNTYEYKHFDSGKKGYNIVVFDKIHFLCSKSALTKFHIKVNIRLSSLTGATFTSAFYALLNTSSISNPLYANTNISYSSTIEHTFEFDYQYYPTKEYNFLNIRLDPGTNNNNYAYAQILSIEIEATGRNLMFISRRNDFKIYISKDYYYITKNIDNKGYYLKTPVSDVNLNSPFTLIPNLIPDGVSTYVNRYYPFNYVYLPKVAYNPETSKFEVDSSVNYFMFCIIYSFNVVAGGDNPVSGVASLETVSNRGSVYVPGHPGASGNVNKSVCTVSTGNYNVSYATMTTTSTAYLQLNGSILPWNCISNVPVFAKNWEDNPDNPFMCVVTNDKGESFFFPSRESTYYVDLGKGYQVNAYLQADGSITVYMCWLNKVYKKTLIYNSETSKYELSDEIFIYNDTTEIVEGYTTDYFTRDVNGNWSYVPAV